MWDELLPIRAISATLNAGGGAVAGAVDDLCCDLQRVRVLLSQANSDHQIWQTILSG